MQKLCTVTTNFRVYLFKINNYLKVVEGKTEVILYNKFFISVKTTKLLHFLLAFVMNMDCNRL